MKKLHEKNLVLRNIDLNTISVTKNKFGCYHLKFNLDLLAHADDTNVNTSGLVINDSIPLELYTYVNLRHESHYDYIIINTSLYEKANKKYLDGYALGNVIDVFRLAFHEKNPKLTKLISNLTAEYSISYNPIQYFYEYFDPNPAFYLNMIIRKFAGSYHAESDKFLQILKKLKEIYYMSLHLFNFINEADEKHHPARINITLQKIIVLKNVLDEFKKNDLSTIDITKTMEKIEKVLDKIIMHYTNMIQHQLGIFIITHLRYSSFDKIKNYMQELFHDAYYSDTIHACIQNLYNNIPKELNHLKQTEILALFMIMQANIEKYIKENGCIDSTKVIIIIKISFLLSYKLSIDTVVNMEVWSKLFNIDIQQLKQSEREFLNIMNHQLIHDPFFSSYHTHPIENKKTIV